MQSDSIFEVQTLDAREILDSRGNPTLEVDCVLRGGALGRAAIPSGASTGSREAVELRDGETRYGGKGVTRAVAYVLGEAARTLKGLDARDQAGIDCALIMLDGTPNKSRLGANTVLGCSLAVAKAVAAASGLPLYRALAGREEASTLPVPMLNVLNGGVHADNSIDLQELMLVPVGFDRFSEALRAGAEAYHALKSILKKRGLATSVGDEGGFAPDLRSHREALDLLMQAIEKAGYLPGAEIALAIDPAANELVEARHEGTISYGLPGEGRTGLTGRDLIALYREWLDAYPLISIEDGLAEDDWTGWKDLTAELGQRVQLIGDDLFVTNPQIFDRGTADGLANALLVKLNQIGSLSETLAAMSLAKASGYACVISHRSGETEDTTIADLAVATGAGQIKTGAPCRTDRVAKYNRLLRIEQELGASASYPGHHAFPRFPSKG